jgi:hypothetical protein
MKMNNNDTKKRNKGAPYLPPRKRNGQNAAGEAETKKTVNYNARSELFNEAATVRVV